MKRYLLEDSDFNLLQTISVQLANEVRAGGPSPVVLDALAQFQNKLDRWIERVHS